MLILPAIDVRGGRCVRLRQGDYAQETVFADDPATMARQWVEQGAENLHLVDLDGAREGHPVNAEAIQAILQSCEVPCQLGGGLREDSHVEEVLSWGVSRVILGTGALKNPEWSQRLCERFPGKIVIGIDAKQGQVATEGWLQTSERTALSLAQECAGWGVAAIVYTDISRDGMMEGPNFSAFAELMQNVSAPIVASGGVTTLADVKRLTEMSIAGCIIGRALYEGTIDLPQAILTVKETMASGGSDPSTRHLGEPN